MATTLTATGITYGGGGTQTTAFSDTSNGIGSIVTGCYMVGTTNYLYGTGTAIAGSSLAANIMNNDTATYYLTRSPLGGSTGGNYTITATEYTEKLNNSPTFSPVRTATGGYGAWYQTMPGSWLSLGGFGFRTISATTGRWTITMWRRYA